MDDQKKDQHSMDFRGSADPIPCPVCGARVEPDQRFCGQCGNALHLTCPACGTENPINHRFCSACGSSLAPSEAASAGTVDVSPEERRWVTVLFADISNFTRLSEQMDPEDVKALVDVCVSRISEEIQYFGGTILRIIGDEVFAVFGAPAAHEDDAERAVRAAVALVDLALLDPEGRQLKVHVGINTGEVITGYTGAPQRQDYTVEGDTVNTAARLRSAAPPGTVLVGESTYQATLHIVRYRTCTPIVARGKELPVPAWEALEIIAAPGSRPLGTAPLIGRDDELMRLAHMWRAVTRRSQPHLVTLLGEPGIGKSRLVAEFERRLPQDAQDAQVLHGRCLPYGETLGYAPLAMALREAAGIMAEDDSETARARLGGMVAEVMEAEAQPAEVARQLALLSGQDVEADHQVGAADERVLRATVRRFLEAAARRRPICLVIDDIHWASDTFLDLLESVAARVRDAALLIVTQARPELLERRPGWGRSVRSFTSLPLGPLNEQVEQDLILALCRERGLSDEMAAEIGRSAGGNPLFAEEMVAMIAEGGTPVNVPSLLQMLISARLDTLPPEERHVIQLASVFGKIFWAGGLRALDDTFHGDFAEQLEALEQKDLLRAMPRSQFRDDYEYHFKHDLIREMAHKMLPRAKRRRLHRRVTDWIEAAAGEQVESYFDLLAHHAIEAGQQERALDYLTRAAERATRVAAHRQAAQLLKEAITIAAGLGRLDTVTDLRFRRGKAFLNVGLWVEARPELEAVLANLPPAQQELRAEVLLALALVHYWVLDPVKLRTYSEEAKRIGEAVGRDDLVAAAISNLAAAASSDGDLEESLELYNSPDVKRAGSTRFRHTAEWALHALIYYWLGRAPEGVSHARESVRMVGDDTSGTVFSLSNLGVVLAGTGDYREATRQFDEARRIGREYEVGPFLARATALSAGYHLDLFDYAGNEAVAEEARELARSANFLPSLISASIDLLLNYARRQEIGRAEQLMGEVVASVEDAAGFHGWLWRLRLAESRAEIALARGNWEEALRLADDAIARSRVRRVKYHVCALRTRARVLEGLGRSREAIACLQEAVALARPTGDPAMFVHAAGALLATDGDDGLLQEARHAVQRINDNLDDEVVRHRFADAEPVRLIHRLSG